MLRLENQFNLRRLPKITNYLDNHIQKITNYLHKQEKMKKEHLDEYLLLSYTNNNAIQEMVI